MCMWGRPDQSTESKKIAACADLGPEHDYRECFRHGQYLMTNIEIERGYPMIKRGSEPELQVVVKYFGEKEIDKLLKKIRRQPRRPAAEQGQARNRSYLPDLAHITDQVKRLSDLRGISFATVPEPSLLPEISLLLHWEADYLVEAIFLMLCRTFWATMPSRRGVEGSWLTGQHAATAKETYGVEHWRRPLREVKDMFTEVHVAGRAYSSSLRLAFNHCFPANGVFKLSKQPYMELWTAITSRATSLQVNKIRLVLINKVCTLSAMPAVAAGKWWKTSNARGVSLLEVGGRLPATERESVWRRGGYKTLDQQLAHERRRR